MGDYAWIDSNTATGGTADAHGLLVVGWQEISACTQVLDALSQNITYYETYDAAIVALTEPEQEAYVVPYVADFNRLQRPSARPFYCTAYPDPVNGPSPGEDLENFFGGDHSWYFYAMPDSVTIDTSNLYVPSLWTWAEFSGQE